MGVAYIDKDEYAVNNNYANWTTYAAAVPNAPTLTHLENDLITEATDIINENIGSDNISITDSRYLSRIKKLCARMVIRMEQIELGQGLPGKIPLFSPNDFLIERERKYLQSTVGVVLGYRVLGGVGV